MWLERCPASSRSNADLWLLVTRRGQDHWEVEEQVHSYREATQCSQSSTHGSIHIMHIIKCLTLTLCIEEGPLQNWSSASKG